MQLAPILAHVALAREPALLVVVEVPQIRAPILPIVVQVAQVAPAVLQVAAQAAARLLEILARGLDRAGSPDL